MPRILNGDGELVPHYQTKEHSSWRSMNRRCYDPRIKNYNRYGGRGITVCDQWRESFWVFLEDMGQAPSPEHSIGRIDNDGNYEPSNCRWETQKQQGNNTSVNRLLTHNGITQTVAQWADQLGMRHYQIRQRLDYFGWSIEKTLETPIEEQPTKITYRGETKPLLRWAEELGIHQRTIKSRLKLGWSVEKAFETPVQAQIRSK